MIAVKLFSLIFAASALMHPMYAQSIVSTAQSAAASTSARSINLHLESVTLAAALDEVSRQSGVQIGYRRGVVSAKPRVTIVANNITPVVALQRILAGTNLEAIPSKAGGFAIRERVAPNRVQGVIAGKVSDAKTGKGISGATVSIGADTRGVTTGEDGSYRLTSVAAGTHTVTVRLVGYAKQTRSVTVGEGATTTADFQLEASANVLDQVIVTGTVVATELKSVPNAITVVTAKQIEERGITKIDQLFRGEIPGLFALNMGSSGNPLDAVTMYSRGATALKNSSATGNSSPIKTYIDGVELADPQYLSQIDPRSIERIEILTGPQASTIYGSNAVNGVMQVFTKRGATSGSQVTLNLQSGWVENEFNNALTSQHDYNGQLVGVEGKLSYSAGGYWNYIGYWTPARQTARLGAFGGARLDIPTGTGGFVTADVALRRGSTVNKARADGFDRLIDYAETGWYQPGPLTSSPGNNILVSQTLGLTLGYAPTNWWSHELVMGQDASDVESRSTRSAFSSLADTTLSLGQNHVDRRSLRYSTTVRMPATSFAQAMVTIGADAWQSLTTSMTVQSQMLTGTLTGTHAITRQPGHNAGGFVQAQLGFMDHLFFTYGLRVEWNPDFGEEAQPNYAPRYGVAYTRELGPVTTKLRASYGRATRPPTVNQKKADPSTSFQDIYGSYNTKLANPFLDPEHQQGGEGGLEMYFGGRGSLVVTRYNQTVNNLIQRILGADSVRSLQPDPLFFGFFDCDFFSTNNLPQICSSQDVQGYGYGLVSQNLNVANMRNQGWELQGNLNLGSVTTKGTYSWTKSRSLGITRKYRDSYRGQLDSRFKPGATLMFLPEHTWALGMTYVRTKTTVALNVSGVGQIKNIMDEFYVQNLSESIRLYENRLNINAGQFLVADAYHSINEDYVLADLTASHRFNARVESVLQVQNLTNHYTKDFNAQEAVIGRQVRAGLRLRLH